MSAICCAVAAPLGWLVARTDMPIRRTVRTLVMASLVTPPFVGAIAWEMLAAPNSGLLNQLWRALTGMPADEALFDIYNLPGLIFVIACYTFPYVFILVANALDRMPGELEDASSMLGAKTWQTARRITVPLALPTLLAGALIAFLQALNLFGSPAILAIPAGFHTLTTRIWSLFQFPPKPELAAAASLPLLLLTIVLLRAQSLALGRRGYAVLGGKYGQPRLVRLGWLRWPAAALALLVLAMPLFLPYAALFNSAFSRVASKLVTFDTITLAQRALHLPRTQLDDAGAQEHLPAGDGLGDPGRAAGSADRLHRRPPRRARSPRCWASSPPRRSPSPASCWASACSSPTRARRSPSTARCGSC